MATLLLILAVIMFYLSWTISAWPPGITGIGFIAIALVFYTDKSG